MKGFVLGLVEAGRKLWQRLSVAQRAFVIGISAAAALGLAWIALEARTPEFRHLISRDLAGGESELQDLCRRLDSKGIAWRRSVSRDGQPGIDVAIEQRDIALGVLSSIFPESELTRTAAREQGGWVFDDIGILSGPSLFGERSEASKRLRVETTIAGLKGVQRARLEYHKPERDFLRSPRTDGSASVTLYLKSGLERLPPTMARGVRRIVCGSYNLPPESVTLTDSGGNIYGVDDTTRKDDEDHERFLAALERDIRGVLSSLFAEKEFTLVVRKMFSAAREAGSDCATGIGGLQSPSSRQTIDLSTPLRGPAGEDAPERRGAAVLATFDHAAVQRVLRSGSPFQTEKDFADSQKHVIETLLFPRPSRVSVFVLPLIPPLVAAGIGAAEGGDAGSSWRKWGVWQDWLEGNWPSFSMVGAILVVVLIGGVTLARRWVSRSRPPRAGGGAAWLRAPRRAATSGDDGTTGPTPWRLFPSRVFPGRGSAGRGVDPLTGAQAQDSLLSATDRMSEWVQERPQTAASVLRVWLEQPAAVPEAEVSRDGGVP